MNELPEASPETVFAEQTINPTGIFGRQWWDGIEFVIQPMIAAAFVALVNQRLKLQQRVGIAWSQRNADGGQTILEPDGIDFALATRTGEIFDITGLFILCALFN